jgi:hypothetical protein
MKIIKTLSWYAMGEDLPVGTKGIYKFRGKPKKVTKGVYGWIDEELREWEGNSGEIDITYIPGVSDLLEETLLW